jgi:hypothetical protein
LLFTDAARPVKQQAAGKGAAVDGGAKLRVQRGVSIDG